MVGRLKLLTAKIRPRVQSGETAENIFADYPLLTEAEKNTILQEVQTDEN